MIVGGLVGGVDGVNGVGAGLSKLSSHIYTELPLKLLSASYFLYLTSHITRVYYGRENKNVFVRKCTTGNGD